MGELDTGGCAGQATSTDEGKKKTKNQNKKQFEVTRILICVIIISLGLMGNGRLYSRLLVDLHRGMKLLSHNK